MHQDVSEGYDLRPRQLRMAAPQVIGNPCGRLADDSELLNHRNPQDRISEIRQVHACDEIGNVVRGLDDVIEVQTVMPHRWAVPRGERHRG